MTDYLYAQTLTKMAAQLAQIPSAPAKDGEGKTDGFQKLLDQKKGSAETPKAEVKTDAKPTEKADAAPVQDSAPVDGEDPQELEKQMALAAMAVMQNPVVTAIEPQDIQPESIVPVEEASAELVAANPDDAPAQIQQEQPIMTEEAAGEAQEETVDPAARQTEAPQAETEAPRQDKVEIRVTARTEETQEDGGEEETPVDVPMEKPVFEDVHDIPVKVGEAPAEEAEPEVPVENQIGDRLAQALNAGDTHVEIQLNPENLGRVTVEMTFAENGSLHVTLHAESGKTMNLLEKGLDNLHMMLAKNTQQEVHVEVQKQEESQQQNFYDGRDGNSQHQEQEKRREHHEERRSEDFLQQLRLGLIPQEE